MVEAVRIGTVFAHDKRQYSRWQSRKKRIPKRGSGLVGAALEAAVMRVAELFPKNVVHGAA